MIISENVKMIIQGLYLCIYIYIYIYIIFILEVSRGPIHGTVTRELNMNGFWDFQQILVYRTAGLLYFIDSFSVKRVRIERVTAVVSRVSMATQPSGRNITPYTNITLV